MNQPFVSVIVPVYNDPTGIRACLASLLSQTYPKDCYEILVVDNGSTDDTPGVVQSFGLRPLYEREIQGSYAARNAGIRQARGMILAFTDGDCTPVSDWIAQGVIGLKTQVADLLSGNVRFVYSVNRSGAEIWDSVTNMQIEDNIVQRNVSKTANLFVQKDVFDEVGLFPTEQKSGGDVIWTWRATTAGKKLAYYAPAEVAHPARGLRGLFMKQLRVGKGQPAIWVEQGCGSGIIASRTLRCFIPRRPRSVRNILLRKGIVVRPGELLRTSLAAYCCSIGNGWGNLIGWSKQRAKKNDIKE